MTDSSPGSKYPGTKPPLAPKPSSYEASRNVSTDNSTQPSSILMSEDHFGSGSTRPTTSHPLDGPSPSCFVCQNGLQFRLRNASEKKGPSFTYASLPQVDPTPMDWKMCSSPDSGVACEHVTYHKLEDPDEHKNLSSMINYHVTESNLVGLIIINTANSTILPDGFVDTTSPEIPIYVVSLKDGDQIEKFVSVQQEGDVQIKISVESTVDSIPVRPTASTRHSPPPIQNQPSQVRLGLGKPTSFNLNDELKRVLFVNNNKKDRVTASADRPSFQILFSLFHNYEGTQKRDLPDKAFKTLDNFTDEMFSKDFPFYLLLCYRFIIYIDVYGNEAVNSFLLHCMEKLEAVDTQIIASTLHSFMQRGDFRVQFSHTQKPDVSVFELLYNMAGTLLQKSNKLQEIKEKQTKALFIGVYRRILWISVKIFFGVHVNIDHSLLSAFWESELLGELKGLAFADDTVKEFARGFELCKMLRLPETACMEHSSFAVFLDPLKLKVLHVTHIIQLLNAWEAYLPWDAQQLFLRFLPPMRTNYSTLFEHNVREWRRFSKDGTKLGAYSEILKFLEYIYGHLAKLNVSDEEKSGITEVVNTGIEKWLELLVTNVDIHSSDAVKYFTLLRQDLRPVQLSKKFKSKVTSCIKTKGLKAVKQLHMAQFFILFKDLQIWPSQFVEDFLNNYNAPMTIDFKDSSWKLLLAEIVYRFSDSHCKKCIVGLLKRAGDAYKSGKKQHNFVMDLMKLDISELLLVKSPKEHDPNVEHLFNEMIRGFIQRNALRDVIITQIVPIMKLVTPNNHFQSLILAAVQKEIVPDTRMIEKFYSSNHLKLLVVTSVTAACKTIECLQQLSSVDKFYWNFIASCCNHIQPDVGNLDRISACSFVVEKLGKIFHEYCIVKKIGSRVFHEVPQDINQLSNSDVKDYFKWIVKMQSIVIHWHERFIKEEFNYDDIFAYASVLPNFGKFAAALNVDHLVYQSTEISMIKDQYSSIYAGLCSLLVKNIKEANWSTLVDILHSYGVRLDYAIQTNLDAHVVLPGRGSTVDPSEIQQGLNQPANHLDLEPEMIIMLRQSTTLKVLKQIELELQNFLDPIYKKLEFLVYFHLHNCEMFSKYLKSQIAKLSNSDDDDVDESDIIITMLSTVKRPAVLDPNDQLEQFAKALDNTKVFILSLIRGTAKYKEIFAEGTMEESLQKFDAESEFKIMCGFPEFKEASSANEEGKQGIKNMLELFQYSQQISIIPDVCNQYHLQKCLDDPKLEELKAIANSCKNAEDRAKITGQIASNYMKSIWKILNFEASNTDSTNSSDSSVLAKKCLKIFPAVANCAEFYQFIQGKGFTTDTGRSAFQSQVQLITAQLQHEDYNETVLNHLVPAFNYITPFLDTEQTLAELMGKIVNLFKENVGFGRDPRKDFCQLETVNSNITMIQLWFSRTEGDTLENVAKELDCIMKTGYFELVICPKRIVGHTQTDDEAAAGGTSEVLLHYHPMKELYHRKYRQSVLNDSASQDLDSSMAMSPVVSERQHSVLLETWNNKQIEDFVRKLGFLEAQTVEQPVKTFQQLNQTAQKLYYMLLKLRDLGHPGYLEVSERISCSLELERAEKMVNDTQDRLKDWRIQIKSLHQSYDKLLFFSVSKVLSLYDILKWSFDANEVIQEIGFLFENSPPSIEKLKKAVKKHREYDPNSENLMSFSTNEMPVEYVGKYLQELCRNVSISEHFLYSRSQPMTSIKGKSLLSFQEIVHFAPNYDNGQLLRLLIEIYNGVPESYEVFHCSEDSTEEDLKLFLNRASTFRYRTFTVLGVNLLPYKLQELILNHHSQEAQVLESCTKLNYIETASSVLHEMPWVVVKEYKENGPSLSWENAKKICNQYVNKGNADFYLELVYGCAGDGKTHYIRKELDDPCLVIAVNESFTPLSAILKLRKLPQNYSCAIFFNFTIVPSMIAGTPEEELKFAKLMNTLAWFFFKLLVFGYVEDLETGMAFRLPGGFTWRIYIEIPSYTDNVKCNLDSFRDCIPIFHLLGEPTLIDKGRSYDVDEGVQLVCKYLRAYDHRGNKKGINKLFIDSAPNVLVKFGDDPDLQEEECHMLLNKYMPEHVTRSKVLQRLFIRYMERRCNFLERFPAFNYNSGCGTLFDDKQAGPNTIREMINNSIIVKLRGRYYSNTSHLGEVLLETMLQEVSEFCKIDVQQNWATQAHQQLIYETSDGAGTIQLITLKPEDLEPNKTRQFSVLGIEIPTIKELLKREKLDFYLSSALGVPLKEGKLQDIDDSHYVLTLDYTIKMLNIHERRQCGIPVIIEGETGVGKTALISMLSKLWNHALINEWRTVKGRIIEMLYLKSLDLDQSNLKDILKQFDSSDQQLDKHLDAPDKYITEEDIFPLLQMNHSLSQGDDVSYFEFINRHLLQLVKTANILELLNVDIEAPPENFNKSRSKSFSVIAKEESVVKELIGNTMDQRSPQATAKLLCTLLNGNLIPTFHKLNIHAALTPKEIRDFFVPIIRLANYLKRVHETKKFKCIQDPPVVTVFLDELNTSSCMGLFKEMIIDRNFEGEPLPSNIFLVAACNPHRGNSLAIHENKDEHKAETWVRGSYYVQQLHPTLSFLMWDYGSLNKDQESAYVRAKMIMVNEDFGIVQNVAFSELVVKCQELIRKFALDQLKQFGMGDKEAKLRATSSVSQRDIQRVFTFYSWIARTYEVFQMPTTDGVSTGTMAMGDMLAACITKHPMISEGLDMAEMKQRALLVALGLVYYMRLDSKYRTRFAEELDKMIPGVKFLTAFTQEMDFYINELSLPAGIAKTEALKENLFATIICTVTNTPLIIVGAPGSSKTLSFNLTISNLKGPESKHKLFRNTEVFKSLDPHYYQCSRRTTSTEIETVFQRAINRQRSHKNFSMPIRCVVFMDEAGLPEESHESLKVLHYHLDQREVAFVAITNHILDAAKTNRAVSLFRPTASQKDLETLAKGCLCANPDKPPPEFKHALDTIVKFCPAYYQVMQDKRLEKFFGLRDFIHFINYIRRHHQGDMSPQLVLQSLERNFNGAVNAVGFEEICNIFFERVGYSLENLKQRTIIDILRSSLDDKPYSNKAAQVGLIRTTSKILHNDKIREYHDTQNEVRYKLIIDPSEDESVTQLLFMFGILKRENTRTYMCSDFPGDGQLQKINTIAAIRHSAIEGHTVIMSQTDDIHESFYDLFNQHFRRIDDPEHGPRYFTNIAIGAHLKPSRVDQEFQCIVVIKESEIKNTPAPFLNRFEKYFISHKNLLNLVLDVLPPCLKVIVKSVATKVEEFYSLLDQSTFYGGNKETVYSLLLGILPKPGHKYELQSQSVVPISEDDTDGTSTAQLGASFVVTPQSSSRKTLLLQILVKCLHELGGFCYMGEKIEELEHDANSIISLLATAGTEFGGVAEELENCEPDAISQWVAEALDLVYTGAAPPDIDTIDYDTCEEEDQFKTLGASDGACMVTALIAQWLVRFMCKKLMQLMTPEAAILKRKSIPISYLETYLNFQTHFNIKELIAKHVHMLNTSGENELPTKLICYTRSNSSVHQLPAAYPRSALSTAEEFQKSEQLIENLICEKAESLLLCKLSSISSQTAFKLQLQSFVDSHQQTVFVLIVNMQETSRQIVNHIRIMIEEAEHVNEKSNKLFVLLLHFPAMMFYDPCYPSLFLPGWDHYYLDTIDQTYNSSLVDTKEWFRQSCLSAKEPSGTLDDPMCKQLLAVLNEPENIQIIASRILLNVDSNELSLESLPDITTKSNYLRKLLTEKKVGDVLCLKFKLYWKPSVMGDHLEQAAKFARSRESTLNITDSVDSMYKAAFFNFVAYMIYRISKSHGLELLFGTYCDSATQDLFLKLLDAYPIPKLSEIKAFNNTWDCRLYTAGKVGYTSQFPFFKEVSTYITNMIEQNVAEVNENVDILQDNTASEFAAGSQDKERMLKRLYEYVCDKTTATIKGEKVAGEKYMSAVAIKEMQNDEKLWQKYYNDFTNYFLHMSSAPNSIEHKLLQLTFTDVLNTYSEMKPIAMHCYIHLYQLDLAKVVALLKPLGQLHIVRDDQASLYPGDPEYTFVSTLQATKAVPGSKNISKFVVESLFAVLINAVYSKNDRISRLRQWYSSYRDMMSMTSLKNILSTKLEEKPKAQCHVMEITFLVLQSFDEITELAEHCASVFTNYMCNKFFTDKFEFKGEVPLNLEQTMICFSVMMQSPQFEEVKKEQSHYHILEGLISHFFPETDSLYCKEDVEYFISFANKQTTWKHSVQTGRVAESNDLVLDDCISLSKFKFHLDKILCKGWSKNGKASKPLNLYKLEVCTCIGETILQQCPGATPNKYIPPYLQQTQGTKNLLMQQTLTHLYFYTLLEKLQTCQYTPSQLVTMINTIDKKLQEVFNDAEKLLLFIERQALIEVILQAVVNSFDVDNKISMKKLLAISDEINVLIKNQPHCDILLMLLIKKHHGPRGVLSLLSEQNKQWWGSFECLKSIREQLKSSPPPTSHLFPFVVGSPNVFTTMYREVCGHLHSMEKDSTTDKKRKFLNFVNSFNDESYDAKRCVRMMIWLGVYYEFYCHKKTSQELINVLESAQKELKLSPEHLNVLKCFLDPTKMIKKKEVANPLNPNAEMLEVTKEGHVKRRKPPSNAPKKDAVWEFFNPQRNEDPSDTDLRHALANMIAVAFALPSHGNHIWYHMFCPGELNDSHITGFMYPNKVKKGGLMYDCGCELNEDGQYGRKDYIPHATRGTISLHSWYLMLWTNFGAFCVGLLTQPETHEKLNGQILSDWMSIRDYCMTQLRTVWLHMRTNMGFGDDERSFFIMRSMHMLFMLFQDNSFPCPRGKFVDIEALNAYEKAWHKHIYEPAKANLQAELENHSTHSVWALPVLKNFRMLDQHYPHLVTENDYMKSLVTAREACNFNPTYLFALHHFTLEYERLQVGGALLPDLVEFYQWIHTHLSHLVSYERAKQITIGNVINLSTKRYTQDICDHLTELFKRIIERYNSYLKVSGGIVGDATCNKALKPSDVHRISEETPLIRLVSLEDTTKNDWLYLVLMDIIGNHNSFLNSIFGHATHSYQKYLPDSPPESHPTEVTSQSCIVPSDGGTGKQQFLKLIKSCYVYNGVKSSPLFDLDQLEQNVVAFYIAGKPQIQLDSIRTIFRFRNSPNEITLGNNPGCAIDLSAIAQELPNKYKDSMKEETRRTFEIHFRTATYHSCTEVVTGLRTVMGHLIQDILRNQDKVWDATLNAKLVDYLKKFYNKEQKVFDEIGIQSISDAQLKLLGDVEMKRLFKCMGLFVGWLQGGLYDFSSLPMSVFKHLEREDMETLGKIPQKYSAAGLDNLLKELDEFEKSLTHAEQHLTSQADLRKSIIVVLADCGLCDPEEKFINLLPKTILVCHYIQFRMALRKLKIKVTTGIANLQTQSATTAVNKWTEIIEDLWKYLPHFQDEEELYDDNCLKFDCVNLQFGDGEESDSDSETWLHHNTSDMEESLVEVNETKKKMSQDELLQKIEENPDLKKAILQTYIPTATLSGPAASVSPSLVVLPSQEAMNMTHKELCDWLKEKKIAGKYLHLFEEDESIDGGELATYTEQELEELGISESRIRKKILHHFRQIKSVQH